MLLVDPVPQAEAAPNGYERRTMADGLNTC